MLNTFCKHPLWEVAGSLIQVAQGTLAAETVIRGAQLVNVCTAEVLEDTDVALWGGRIAYVGQADHCIGEGTELIEAHGAYLSPGFLDGHIHVESSMLGVGEYARAVIPHGTVGIYMDPHEICNVLGLEGVKVMDADGRRTPLKAMITTPSCVPAVPGFEDTGSSIGPADIAQSMSWPSVVGLGEMMNFPGILAAAPAPLGELAETLKADKVVTGHYSIPETDRGLNAYVASGVRCCHESTRAEDALAKMRLGMYALLREGSAWRDLAHLAPALASKTVDTRFACLISDDTHPHTLVEQGHLDHLLRRAVEEGIDAITALQMVTINTATCFRMDNELGSVTPGKCADLVLLEDLESFKVQRVWIDGNEVARDGEFCFNLPPFTYPEWVTHSMHVGTEIEPGIFAIPAPAAAAGTAESLATTPAASAGVATARVRVIEIIPERVGTFEAHLALPVINGLIEGDVEQDTLKCFVFERHHETGTFGCGFVKGFGIKHGALASTVAHDAHNLLVMGSNNEDMALAAQTLIDCGGGMVAVRDGVVLGLVPLPIAGLMSNLSAVEMSQRVATLEAAWKSMDCTIESPMMTMALIPLACLPELRLTNRGLVDCTTFSFAELLVDLDT